MKKIIELKNVSKSYGTGSAQVRALKSVSLSIDDGDDLVIAGPSGSGKSTLLQLIGGLDKSSEGEIFIDGEDINKLSDTELSKFRNKKIGFIFQFFNLIEYMTALENVAWPMIINGTSEKEAYTKSLELLEKVGLKKRANHIPRQLSGGEMQRVAIARSLANAPKIILADEPTGNLDKENTKNILALLQEISTTGVTVIIVTHDPRVSDYFKNILHVENGEIAHTSTTTYLN